MSRDIAATLWVAFLGLALVAQPQSGILAADPDAATVDRHLAAGEFGPALRAAENLPRAEKNNALSRISAAQQNAGITSSLATASAFSTPGGPFGGPGAPGGGGVQADFDTLITLVQETISPDSWEEAGGPGRISPFPLGVHVDATGLLRRIASSKSENTSLLATRLAALRAKDGRDVRAASAMRKVSLTRLERAVQERISAGLSPSDAMRQLAGLRRVEYLFVYPETGDIVIAGPAGDWTTDAEGRAVAVEPPSDEDAIGKETTTPVLHLDDLLVLLRQAKSHGPFTCTIEPTTEGLAAAQGYIAETGKKPLKEGKAARDKWVKGLRDALGKQNIKVGGIDARTRVARTIVEADYHMKRIGMGLERGVPGVVSYLDSIELKEGEAPPPMDVLRWWFTLAEVPPSTTEEHNAFSFHKGSVRVLSENEFLKATGEIVYTGKSSERNLKFANSFTNHFDALATKYPVYADLRNVFDLALVAALIENQSLADQVGWQMGLFLDGQQLPVDLGPMPKQVESICNSRLVNGKHVVAGVSGGVDVDVQKLVGDKMKVDTYGTLKAGHGQSTPKKVANDWWWD
jgi:hypothetical protein